jgi:flagellar biosynthetic protein FliP
MGGIADLFNNPDALNLQNLSPPVQVALLLGLTALLPAALVTVSEHLSFNKSTR